MSCKEEKKERKTYIIFLLLLHNKLVTHFLLLGLQVSRESITNVHCNPVNNIKKLALSLGAYTNSLIR